MENQKDGSPLNYRMQ